MSKTIRHNREGKQYKDKDSAGVCYHTSVLDSRKRVVPKNENALHTKYGIYAISYILGYAGERDAKSDRHKRARFIENKLLRNKLKLEAKKEIYKEIYDELTKF